MGLTQNVGEDGIKFEVWVRQATRTRDCVTLQAKDREEKAAWTQDVAHLLWTHAINNTGRSTIRTHWVVSAGAAPLLELRCIVVVQ